MNCDGPVQDPEIFRCRMCGDCCVGYGGTALAAEDLEAISAYIGVDRRRFLQAYCIQSGPRILLAQSPDGRCIFWDELCTIHPVKPAMCKAWPYLPAVLTDPTNWKAMGSVCPGIRTDLPEEVVQSCVRREIEKTRSG